MSSFKEFIQKLLSTSGLNQPHIEMLTTPECMIEYEKAFTSRKYNPENNYEFYEILGDATSNKVVVWYYLRRFSNLFKNSKEGEMGPIAMMARLKMVGVSTTTYSQFANQLGFFKYIKATDEDKLKKNNLLEDVFEAFLGCTELLVDTTFGSHTGYSIVYEFMKNLMDKKEISLDIGSLYDNKSLVNNKANKLRGKGIKVEYITTSHYEEIDPDDVEKVSNRIEVYGRIFNTKTNKELFKTKSIFSHDKASAEQKVAKLILDSGMLEKLI